jgi:hypothetical protein
LPPIRRRSPSVSHIYNDARLPGAIAQDDGPPRTNAWQIRRDRKKAPDESVSAGRAAPLRQAYMTRMRLGQNCCPRWRFRHKYSADIPTIGRTSKGHPHRDLKLSSAPIQFPPQVIDFRVSSGACTRNNGGNWHHIQAHPEDIKTTSKASLHFSRHLQSPSQIKLPLDLTLPVDRRSK